MPPPEPMTATVMTTTEGDQVAITGRSPLRPGDPVIQVTVPGWPATAGEDAAGVPGLDQPSRLPPWSSPGHPGMGRHPRLGVGDGKAPRAMSLLPRHLAGDIGDHRTKAPEFSRSLAETGQGLQVDPELDRAPVALLFVIPCLPQQELQQEIGPELVHGPFLPLALQLSCQAGQPLIGGLGPVGGRSLPSRLAVPNSFPFTET